MTSSLGCLVGISGWTCLRQTFDSSSSPVFLLKHPWVVWSGAICLLRLKPCNCPWLFHSLDTLCPFYQPYLLAWFCLQKYIKLYHCHLGIGHHYPSWATVGGSQLISFLSPCSFYPQSPQPLGHRPSTGPVRNWTTQHDVSGEWVSKASSVFTASPHCLHHCLSSASCQVSSSIRFS